MRATASLLVVLSLFVAALAISPGHAQESQSILPALLTEVRGLRAAMEQMAAAGPRVQLALGRLQLQEQRVNTLLRRLETVRDSLASAERELLQHQNQLATFEAMRDRGVEPNRPPHEEIEQMLKNFKNEASRASAEVQRLTAEEISIAGELATEQARWTDLNQRLEELERSLGAVRR